MVQPLAFDVSTFNVPKGIVTNIESAVLRRLPELPPAICSHDGTFVIAGSGPSLAQTFEDLKEERRNGRPICAVKGAHDFLVERDIEPELFFSIDPRDRRNNVQRETERTVYVLSSRCAPSLFDYLAPRKVMMIHCGSQQEENEAMARLGAKFMLGGMSTSGLRAINLGYYLGFRRFVLYGMDSCNAEDGITKRVDGSLTGQTTVVIVGDAQTGKRFTANIAMAQQAQDFQQTWVMMPDARVEVKGGGLIAAIVEERKRRGYWT